MLYTGIRFGCLSALNFGGRDQFPQIVCSLCNGQYGVWKYLSITSVCTGTSGQFWTRLVVNDQSSAHVFDGFYGIYVAKYLLEKHEKECQMFMRSICYNGTNSASRNLVYEYIFHYWGIKRLTTFGYYCILQNQ